MPPYDRGGWSRFGEDGSANDLPILLNEEGSTVEEDGILLDQS